MEVEELLGATCAGAKNELNPYEITSGITNNSIEIIYADESLDGHEIVLPTSVPEENNEYIVTHNTKDNHHSIGTYKCSSSIKQEDLLLSQEMSQASDENIPDELASLLPDGFHVKLKKIDKTNYKQGFEAILRVNIKDKLTALKWLKEFSTKSLFTFRVDKTYPENTKKIVFKKEYRCMHNTRPTPHSKPRRHHTACNAKVTITVKQMKQKRSRDVYLQEFPTEVLIRHVHNHPLLTANTFKSSPLGKDEEEDQLFFNGHSPSSTLEMYEYYKPSWDNHYLETNNIKNRKENILDLQLKIDEVANSLKTRLSENPDIFTTPINKFIKSYEGLKTETSVVCALQSFGNYNVDAATFYSRKETLKS